MEHAGKSGVQLPIGVEMKAYQGVSTPYGLTYLLKWQAEKNPKQIYTSQNR